MHWSPHEPSLSLEFFWHNTNMCQTDGTVRVSYYSKYSAAAQQATQTRCKNGKQQHCNRLCTDVGEGPSVNNAAVPQHSQVWREDVHVIFGFKVALRPQCEQECVDYLTWNIHQVTILLMKSVKKTKVTSPVYMGRSAPRNVFARERAGHREHGVRVYCGSLITLICFAPIVCSRQCESDS